MRSYRYDDDGQVEEDKFVWGITVSNYQNREKGWELTAARPTKSWFDVPDYLGHISNVTTASDLNN